MILKHKLRFRVLWETNLHNTFLFPLILSFWSFAADRAVCMHQFTEFSTQFLHHGKHFSFTVYVPWRQRINCDACRYSSHVFLHTTCRCISRVSPGMLTFNLWPHLRAIRWHKVGDRHYTHSHVWIWNDKRSHLLQKKYLSVWSCMTRPNERNVSIRCRDRNMPPPLNISPT